MEKDFDSKLRIESNSFNGGNIPRSKSFELGRIYGSGSYSKEEELIVHGRLEYEKGNLEEAANECKSVLDAMEKIFYHGILDVLVDNKFQEIVSGAVELLPELWKLDGSNHEAMSAYRRGLLSQWNLDNDCCARIRMICYLFAIQWSGGKTKWDPSVMEHLTFALSLCSQTSILTKQLEEIMPGVFHRANRWKAMALCYSGAGQNKGLNGHLKGVGLCMLGLCLEKLAKVSSSDHERSRLQTDALKSLDEAIVLKRNNFDLIFELGVQYAERWNLNAALRYAKQFIDATGGSVVKGWRLLALILSAQQRFLEAEVVIDAALDETAK
ncbi:Protein NPG1 [Camellia lanceoleosa]|uniref:Protein NPG1 n=1 Tax=Camellia lanceoleosa TaxID=1840588 RepID=A0ACC0GFV8_9ERIC|nr:Protein NPG1 [Camellia lanceoleosa]